MTGDDTSATQAVALLIVVTVGSPHAAIHCVRECRRYPEGMDAKALNEALSIVPHEVAAGVDCCGCILAEVERDTVKLLCNECGAVVGTVDFAIFTQLLRLECARAICPQCGKANAFPGFTEVDVYTCQHCGRGVEPPSPAVQ